MKSSLFKGAMRALAAACAALVAVPATALTLTVGGTSYDITLNLGSFNDVTAGPNGPLTATPWYSDATLASDLAAALFAADAGAGGTLVPDNTAAYLFADDSGPAWNYQPASVGSEVFETFYGATETNLGGVGPTIYFATGSAIPGVPEIDGNALAKALFILFALGVWLDVRRRRTV